MGIIDLAVILIVAGFIFRGYRKGFVVTVLTLVSMFVAIIVTQIVSPIVSGALIRNETVMETMTEQISSLSSLWANPDEDTDETEGIRDNTDMSDEEKTEISNLHLPANIKDKLGDNEMWEEYKQEGIENIKEYVSRFLAITIINSLSYVVVFLIVITLLKILIHTLDIISKLPVLKSINKYVGAALGFAEGVIVIWILCIITTLLASTPLGIYLFDAINSSPFLSYIYNNNLLISTVLEVVKGLF